tara:strand:- start:17 stop:286 length:270 start_codon:yes stop_codon:yes gene_type:complete
MKKYLLEKKKLENGKGLIFEYNFSFYLNSVFKKIHLGILKIIDKSSKKLLLLDKNFIAVFGELSNILKNISGIFSGFSLSTCKKILSKN